MATLIAVYNAEGCAGRCDARCYGAKLPDCTCVCGGKNHGKGLQVALQNTRQQFPAMLSIYCKANNLNGDDVRYDVPALQLNMKTIRGVL